MYDLSLALYIHTSILLRERLNGIMWDNSKTNSSRNRSCTMFAMSNTNRSYKYKIIYNNYEIVRVNTFELVATEAR